MKRHQKAILASVVTASQAATLLNIPVTVMAQEPDVSRTDRVAKNEALQPKSGYTFIGAPVAMPEVQNNIVTVRYANGEKSKITFLENNLFRFDMEVDGQDGSFKDYADPNDVSHTGRIVQQPDSSDEYTKPTPTVGETQDAYSISNDAIVLEVSKTDARMTLKRTDGTVVWQEAAPIQYKTGSTIQSFVKNEGENFYGGGTQNGRFVHTGESIKIENLNNWVSGGVASPNPFYWSTNGYGVLRNTFKKGEYDFGKTQADVVSTSHTEKRLDAYYFVGDTPISLLQSYFKVTGNPALFPEEAFYLGHLNCYNRDEWTEGGGTPLETINDSSKYQETNNGGKIKRGGVLETLNGTNETDYKFSARGVIDQYDKYDMPLGWFLPNDGYGCGYGQDDTNLDNNIANLKSFTDYANSKGVGTGLWTQSDLTPNPNQPIHLQRDFEKEVYQGGIRTLKTDVAWVGAGYSFGLNGISKAYDIITKADTRNRPTIVTLDGWAGTQRYGGIWTGDQTGGNWEYIRFHIPTYIGQSLSGNPNVSSDVDGIFGGSSLIQTRDIQWKSFTTMMLDMDGWGSYPKKPYVFGEDTTSINRMYLKLRSQLMPYIYSTAYSSANLGEDGEKGKPQVRAMFLEFPEDANAYGKNVQYQFMLGKNLLVAPVYQNTAADGQGNDIRNGIYLPDSNQIWIDYFTGKQYQGGSTLNNFDAPIWKLPLFVKNGAILPMTEAHNNGFAKSETNTKGVDKSKRMIEFYPAGETDYTLYEDAGNTVDNTNTSEVNYGSAVTTHFTSTVTGEKAVLKAEASQGSYVGYDANKETQFVVNVSEKPSSIQATVGANDANLTEVHSQKEFDEATGNVYYYNESPDLNRFATPESDFASVKITTTPKLYVKFAKTDVSANAIELSLEGFKNDGDLDKNVLNKDLKAPANVRAPEESITPDTIHLQWDAVENATGYEVEADGVIQTGFTEPEFDHTDLAYHSKHTYRVRARNKDGYSQWSEPLEVQSAQDPYRNVPKDIQVTWEYGDAWGKLANILDFDTGTMFHSTKAVQDGQAMIYDLKKIYDLDRIEYTPRLDNKGNGTVQKMDVYTSLDGTNWTLAYDSSKNPEWTYSKDMSDPDTKTMDMTGQKARYIKYVVKKSVGGFFSAAELQPYKVDGTEGYIVGDTNNDGTVDDNDVVQIDNYVGLEEGDPTWDQVKRSDWNDNKYFDAADIAQTTSRLGKGIAKTGGDPKGSLVIEPDKTHYSAGEKVTLSIQGISMENVYALGGKIPYNSEDLQFVSVSSDIATGDQREFVFDRIAYQNQEHPDKNRNVNFAYSNLGDQPMLSGTNRLATVTFTAKKDLDIKASDFNLSDFMFVSNNMNYIDPLKPSEDLPEPETESKIQVLSVEGQDESVLQPGMGVDKLIDGAWGSDANRFEFKWGNDEASVPARLPYWIRFNFGEIKKVSDVMIHVRVDGNRINGGALKDFDLYRIKNGVEQKIGSYVIDKTEDENAYVIHFADPIQAEGFKFNAKTSQAGQVFKLNIDEVEFRQNAQTPIEDISLDEANPTTLNVGDLKGFKASVAPDTATNKLIKIESSDPEVLEVIRTTRDDHYEYTLHALKPGTVTLTITSNGQTVQGEAITRQVEITVNEAVTSKEELESKIEEANAILANENLYTPSSLDVLKNALKLAQNVEDKKDATQTEVNAQVVQLYKAIQQLEYRGSNTAQPDSENPIVVDPANVTATTSASEGPVENAFDGDQATYWHSGWEQGTEKLPQSVTVDLADEYDVEQVNYLPRQGSRNGDIIKYQIETSEDGETFKPVVVGTIENDGSSIVERTQPHKIKFDKTKARYVRITALESLGNQNNLYASAAEFSIFGALHSDAIPATSIELDKTELKLDAGNTETVTATILPEDTTDTITWESSDPSIASVEALGRRRVRRDANASSNTSTVTVTALKAGTVTITAKANDTVSKTLTVTVENPKQEQLAELIEQAKGVKYENAALQDYLTSEIEKATQALDQDQDTLQNAYYALAGALSEIEEIQKDIDQLNSFSNIDDSRYVPNEQYQMFKEQLQLAQNLLSDPVQNKELIKTHVDALKKAFAQLEELDREKLSNAIQEAEKVNLQDCVEDDALSAFKTALENAKAANPQSNEEIDTLVNTLLEAQAGLHFKDENLATDDQKESIQHALDVLKNLDLDLYSEQDGKTIKAAISDGEDALANKDLTKEEASKVIDDLAKALSLEPKEVTPEEELASSSQKEVIAKALDILKGLDLNLYDTKAQGVIQETIEEAQKAADNDQLTKEEAAGVLEHLANALSIQPKEDTPKDEKATSTQKEVIEKALDILKDLDLNKYEAKDADLIKEAIEATQKALGDKDLTYAEATDTIEKIAQALLVTPKETEQPNPSDNENPNTNTPDHGQNNSTDTGSNGSNTVIVNPTDSSKSKGNTKTGVHSFVGLFAALATSAAATAGTVTLLKNKKIRIRRKGKK